SRTLSVRLSPQTYRIAGCTHKRVVSSWFTTQCSVAAVASSGDMIADKESLMRQISRRGLLVGGAVSQASRLLLSPVLLSAADAQVTAGAVQFRPEIEPLVELIERTPREKCAEMVVDQMRRGTSYRQLLAALFLAGVRNVNPRPPGFALHCVFVIHAAHLLGLEAPSDARLLPLFFALDDFKTSQDRDARAPAGDFTMRSIRGS